MIGFIDVPLQSHSFLTAYNQDCLRFAPFLTGPRASSLPLWRMTDDASLLTRRTPLRPTSVRQITPTSRIESYVTTDGQSARVSWTKAPICGLRPDFNYCQTVAGLFMWGSLWREDGSVVYNCYWPSPAQSFSGPSPEGLPTILYSIRLKKSLFVASYDSQGYGGDIRPRLHTGSFLRMNYDSFYKFQATRKQVIISHDSSVILCYPLPRKSVPLLIFFAAETCVNLWQIFDLHQPIRCSWNLCLPKRCLAMDYSSFQASCHNIINTYNTFIELI
jgi:hypothetical protein